jgi:hypothetical protein
MLFGGKYFTQWLFAVRPNPNIYNAFCLDYFPHSLNMLKCKINFSWIQASPRESSCQDYHLVSSIYLLKPCVQMSGISRA